MTTKKLGGNPFSIIFLFVVKLLPQFLFFRFSLSIGDFPELFLAVRFHPITTAAANTIACLTTFLSDGLLTGDELLFSIDVFLIVAAVEIKIV